MANIFRGHLPGASLEQALASSTAAWKIVVGQHPLHTASGSQLDEAELIAVFEPMMCRHNFRAYINGAGSRIEGPTQARWEASLSCSMAEGWADL